MTSEEIQNHWICTIMLLLKTVVNSLIHSENMASNSVLFTNITATENIWRNNVKVHTKESKFFQKFTKIFLLLLRISEKIMIVGAEWIAGVINQNIASHVVIPFETKNRSVGNVTETTLLLHQIEKHVGTFTQINYITLLKKKVLI